MVHPTTEKQADFPIVKNEDEEESSIFITYWDSEAGA